MFIKYVFEVNKQVWLRQDVALKHTFNSNVKIISQLRGISSHETSHIFTYFINVNIMVRTHGLS